MFKQFIGAVKAFGSKHSTAITSVVTIAGYAATVILAIHETRTFDERIEELKISNDGKELQKKDIVVTAIKSYAPAIATFGVTTICHIGGQWSMLKKYNNLQAAYATTSTAHSMLEKSFREYKKAVEKTVTEKQNEKIKDEEVKEIVKDVTPAAIECAERVPTTSSNIKLCMERWTHRLFWADPIEIKDGFNRFKENYKKSEIASLEDLFYEWGLKTYDKNINESGVASRLGWRTDIHGDDIELEVRYTGNDTDTEPIMVFGTDIFPESNFDVYEQSRR